MLFYRRKLLLAVLEAFGGSIESLKFQKYLFLVSNQIDKKYYDFIPYHYGCFSLESYNDKRNLMDSGYLKQNEKKWILKENCNFLSEINSQDKKHILSVKKEYGKLSKPSLLNNIYSRYPYYAIKSQIISEAKLNFEQRKQISDKVPGQKKKCLFTIGYEGRSIDKYLNLLIKNNIKVLLDVRKNPISRKYGFSKKSLQNTTRNLEIEYLHIPELGITSQSRQKLNTKEDYKKLFSFYEKKTLPLRENELKRIIINLNRKKRVALTCFESDPSFCHRHCISVSLKRLNPGMNIKHL